MLQLLDATTADQLDGARTLFQEYEKGLGISLCFQNFSEELKNLPGEYASPRGALLLAFSDGELAGCCALRPLNVAAYPKAAEMKRLFVRPDYRGKGIARKLVYEILRMARAKDYDYVVLDTLNTMKEAQALYVLIGFRDIPPYYENPIEGARYMLLDLRQASLLDH
jgi:ribosomal protein S18 acetylase RimI-like enzyme